MNWIGQQHIKIKNTVTNWRQRFKACQTQQIFGLDIGTSAIKIVQLCKNENGYAVTAAGIAYVDDLSPGKEINISKAIRQCLHSAAMQTKLAVCGVCGQDTAVRYFTFPALMPEEIEGAIKFEAKQVCPFNTDDGVTDYQVISSSEKEIQGYLVVATSKLIKEKIRFVKESELDSVLMDVDGLALVNCLRNCQEIQDGQTAAILNVGSSYTTLAIISGDNLPFVRDLNYAGKSFIEHLALQNEVSPETVEEILRGGANQDNRLAIRENLEMACQKLVTNVTETLYYDAVRRKSEIVDKVFLCGGFALVDGFVDLMKSKLPAETLLWNPFDKKHFEVSAPFADLLREKGPAFAVAAGLAMRQI